MANPILFPVCRSRRLYALQLDTDSGSSSRPVLSASDAITEEDASGQLRFGGTASRGKTLARTSFATAALGTLHSGWLLLCCPRVGRLLDRSRSHLQEAGYF